MTNPILFASDAATCYTMKHGRNEVLICLNPGEPAEEVARAGFLAKALRGRESRRFGGWWLKPGAARQWALLFDDGWGAIIRRNGSAVSRHFRRKRDGMELELRPAMREIGK